MSKNNPSHTNSSKRPQKSPLQQRPSKILRVDDPTFENEVNELLLESDQSDTEDNIVDCLVSEEAFIQNHESDQGEDEENPSIVENSNSGRNSNSNVLSPYAKTANNIANIGPLSDFFCFILRSRFSVFYIWLTLDLKII